MLGGLTQLTDVRLANAIAANNPSYIKLDKLKQIEPNIAEALTNAKCSLMLSWTRSHHRRNRCYTGKT